MEVEECGDLPLCTSRLLLSVCIINFLLYDYFYLCYFAIRWVRPVSGCSGISLPGPLYKML